MSVGTLRARTFGSWPHETADVGDPVDEQWLAPAQDALGTARRPAGLLLQDRERALRHAAHTYASGHTIFDAIASGGGGLVATLVIEAAFLALLRR